MGSLLSQIGPCLDYGVSCIEHLEKSPEKCCDHSSAFISIWIVFILAGNKTTITAWVSLIFNKTPLPTTELAALERLKNNK